MVHWTDAEWTALAKAVYDSYRKDPTPSFLVRVNQAIRILPKSRHRKITTMAHVPRLLEDVTALFANEVFLEERVIELEKRLADSKASDELLSEMTDRQFAATFRSRILSVVSVEELSSSLSLEDLLARVQTPRLIGEVARRLATDYFGDLKGPSVTLDTVPSPEEDESAPENRPTAPMAATPRAKKLHVVVCGPLPTQQPTIKTAMKNLPVKMTFVSSSDNPLKIPQAADLYAAWTKFCGHGHTDACKRYSKPGCLLLQDRSINHLIDTLQVKVVSLLKQ